MCNKHPQESGKRSKLNESDYIIHSLPDKNTERKKILFSKDGQMNTRITGGGGGVGVGEVGGRAQSGSLKGSCPYTASKKRMK